MMQLCVCKEGGRRNRGGNRSRSLGHQPAVEPATLPPTAPSSLTLFLHPSTPFVPPVRLCVHVHVNVCVRAPVRVCLTFLRTSRRALLATGDSRCLQVLQTMSTRGYQPRALIMRRRLLPLCLLPVSCVLSLAPACPLPFPSSLLILRAVVSPRVTRFRVPTSPTTTRLRVYPRDDRYSLRFNDTKRK